MPDKDSSNDTAPTPPKGRSVMRTFVTVALSLCLVAMGYIVGTRGSSAAPAASEHAPDEEYVESEEPAIGLIVDLDAVNVNLADGHYLRIAVSLGVSEDVELHDPAEFRTAPASDVVLTTFAGRTVAELATAEGREAARQQLAADLEPFYGSDVVAVYFTEFVMQ